VQEHRRNGWYVLGGALMAAGVAWLAAWGVAVGSAKPPGSVQYLVPASYVAIGVVVIGFLVVVAVMYDWPARLRGLYPASAGAPLKVIPGKAHYHDWNYAASVAALPITITNRTREPVVMPGGMQGEFQFGSTPAWEARLSDDDMTMFLREVESQRRTSHHQPALKDGLTIPGGATIEAWHVTEISRDKQGTRPRITLRFKDGDNNTYTASWNERNPAKRS
jgi:hypothetical protein